MKTGLYLTGSIITIVCILVCLFLFIFCKSKDSKGNRIELQNGGRTKPWKLGSWIAGVFVAGTGVALMYAPADIVGYVQLGLTPIESILMVALLNGAPVWALYSVVGLWYMKHMDSKIGKIAAILSTIFGMSISLWTGMNTVVNFLGFSIPGIEFMFAGFVVLIASLSAKFNWLEKISKLSFLIFVCAFLILISIPHSEFQFVPISGSITGLFFEEYFIGPVSASWIFWFISWTPTVARWLAQISVGRTMKEYIAGTMFLPTILALVWMGVSWMYQDVILNFNLKQNVTFIFPCLIFIASGLFFMIGTLDSDCKVFSEDLSRLSRNKIKKENIPVFYVIFILFFYCLFSSGIIKDPFAFNEYSSLIFVPLVLWAIFDCVKYLCKFLKSRKIKDRTQGESL